MSIPTIKLPKRLERKLNRRESRGLYGIVLENLEPFAGWLYPTPMPLFPDYTDHGPGHVEDVLKTASSLIDDKAAPVVTSEDSATLIVATLLHDSAMHLAEKDFLNLIDQNYNWPNAKYFENDTPWPILWEGYLEEVLGYEPRRRVKLFETENVVRDLPIDSGLWRRSDRLLAGEFIRRHHHRLAHEISQNGIPRSRKSKRLLAKLPDRLLEIAGLVARSHGVSIREAKKMHESIYDDVRCIHNIHVIYLMILLRIADYLQVQAERASKETMSLRQIRSPIARVEWFKHQAVECVSATHPDPKAVFISVKTLNSGIGTKVRRLLSDIQSEFEACNAMIDQEYARYKEEKLDKLKLKYSRIRAKVEVRGRAEIWPPY